MAVKKKKKSRKFRYFTKIEAEPKPNPFDLKANHKKYSYVSRGHVKGESGRPTESRSRAIERRKTRIERHIKANERANRFQDRRAGENNAELSEEQKSLLRLQAMKSALSAEIDVQPDCAFTTKPIGPVDGDDDEDGEEVMEALWSDEDEFASQSERLRDAVAKAKLAKAERVKEKTEVDETTTRMNTEWESMRPLLRFRSEGAELRQSMPDEYDYFVQSLRFSERAKNAGSEREMKFESKQEYERRMAGEAAQRMKAPAMRITRYVSPDDLDLEEEETTTIVKQSRPCFLTELSHVPASEEKLKPVPQSFESFLECVPDMADMLRWANPLRTGGDKTELTLLVEHAWNGFLMAAARDGKAELLMPLTKTLQTVLYHYPDLWEPSLRAFLLADSFELAPTCLKNAVLRLVGHLYSSTDYRHRMGSAALLRGADLLRSYRCDTLDQCRDALNTCLIMTEYVEAPGRLMPELIHCLLRIMQNVGGDCPMGCTKEACGGCVLRATLKCLRTHMKTAARLPCGRLYLERIAATLEGTTVQETAQEMREELDAMLTEGTGPRRPAGPPNMIRMKTPLVKSMSVRAAADHQRRLEIRRRYKKEMRCAAREIKREGQVLSGLKLEKQKMLDQQRMEKVKRIMDDLANQEGDYRKIRKTG